jgi:hypothetical protein
MLLELAVLVASAAASAYSLSRNFPGGSGSEGGALNALIVTAATPVVMTGVFVVATGSSVGMSWEAAAAVSVFGSYSTIWAMCYFN